MSEKMQRSMIKTIPVSLAILSWVVFIFGLLIVKPMWLKIVLLSAAWVLP